MTTIVKASTKKGQELVNRSMIDEGFRLSDVYSRPSAAKQSAWEHCYNKYALDEYADDFHITSHNTNFFTVTWDSLWIDPVTGEAHPATFMETAKNSYIILLDC